MASKRIALSIPPESDKILTRLSVLTKTPKTAIITNLVIQAMPVFIQAVNSLQKMHEGQQEIGIRAMTDLLKSVESDVNQANLKLQKQLGEVNGRNE